MSNFLRKRRKVWAAALILCLICGLTPTAESISVKLRGKVALVGILSGLAYVTHTLVKRDRRALEKLEFRLGPPDRVIQFERGFDVWRINYYGEQQRYLFRNGRFIEKKVLLKVPLEQLHWKGGSLEDRREGWNALSTFQFSNFLPSLINTPVSGYPKWLRLCPLHPQRVPQLVFPDLYRKEKHYTNTTLTY